MGTHDKWDEEWHRVPIFCGNACARCCWYRQPLSNTDIGSGWLAWFVSWLRQSIASWSGPWQIELYSCFALGCWQQRGNIYFVFTLFFNSKVLQFIISASNIWKCLVAFCSYICFWFVRFVSTTSAWKEFYCHTQSILQFQAQLTILLGFKIASNPL